MGGRRAGARVRSASGAAPAAAEVIRRRDARRAFETRQVVPPFHLCPHETTRETIMKTKENSINDNETKKSHSLSPLGSDFFCRFFEFFFSLFFFFLVSNFVVDRFRRFASIFLSIFFHFFRFFLIFIDFSRFFRLFP